MTNFQIINTSNHWKKPSKPLTIAFGNFDGVHRGHQVILKKCVSYARSKGFLAFVYTFDPHPAKILAPKTSPLLIQTKEQKVERMKALGLDGIIFEKFDLNFSKQKPKYFFEKIVLNRLHAKALFVGYDFTFGYKRSGTVETLKNLCNQHHIPIFIIPPQFEGEILTNSTQIRNLVGQGKMNEASKLLGRPFALVGKVVQGFGIGGKLGIHTANLKTENELLPKVGIYITQTRIQKNAGTWEKKYWPSATSVGFNPTFPGKGFSVETHLIGFKGDLKNKRIEVSFLQWLREEMKFPNEETLAMQIKQDILKTKQFYETFWHHR